MGPGQTQVGQGGALWMWARCRSAAWPQLAGWGAATAAAGCACLPGRPLAAEGQQLMFCNTYHLLLHPGADVVGAAGGLHAFMNRQAPLITDSGGFQVCVGGGCDTRAWGNTVCVPRGCRGGHRPPLVSCTAAACMPRHGQLGLSRPPPGCQPPPRPPADAGLFAGLRQRARGGELAEARQRQEQAQAGAQPGGKN